MKAKRFLITKILLAVAMCLAIVFAFVPWSVNRAYADGDTVINSATLIHFNGYTNSDNKDTFPGADPYITSTGSKYNGGTVPEWSYGDIKGATQALKQETGIEFYLTTGCEMNITIGFSAENKNVKINGTNTAKSAAPAIDGVYLVEQKKVAAGKLIFTKGGSSGPICFIELTPTYVAVESITVENAVVPLKNADGTSGTGKLVANFVPENPTNKNIAWAVTEGTDIISIDATTGIVTALKVGTATVTATPEGGGNAVTCTVTVTNAQTYKVSYEVDGKEYLSENVLEDAILDRPEDPSKDNAVFDNWYTTVDGTDPFDFANTPIKSDTTIYGRYHVNPMVTYESAHGVAPEAEEVLYNTPATKAKPITALGYTFEGWYLNGVPYNGENLTATTVTLTAKWGERDYDAVGTYTLTVANYEFVVTGSDSECQKTMANVFDTTNMLDQDKTAFKFNATPTAESKADTLVVSVMVKKDQVVTISLTAKCNSGTAGLLHISKDGTAVKDITYVPDGAYQTDTYECTATSDGIVAFELARGTESKGIKATEASVTIADPVAPVVEDVVASGYSATISDNIGFNFFVTLNNGKSADKVVASYVGGNPIEMAMPTAEADGTYKITVNVVAKLMAEKISIQLYNGTEKVGNPIEYSVKEYAEKLLADTNQSACHELVKALLNYGAAVQTQLGYNTGNLANANYAQDAAAVADTYKLTADEVKLSETTVTLKSVNVYFLTDTTLVVRFNANENVTFTCEGKTVNTTVANGVVSVEISGIKAKEINTALTISVVDGATTGSVEISVSNYCYAAQTKATANMQAAAKALHAYGLAAANYKG